MEEAIFLNTMQILLTYYASKDLHSANLLTKGAITSKYLRIQNYLCKCKDTYFVRWNTKYLRIYEHKFEQRYLEMIAH